MKETTAVMSYETSQQDSSKKLDLTQNIENIYPRNVKISSNLNSNTNIILH